MTLAAVALAALFAGLWWGERCRRLDLLHARRFLEERAPSNPLLEGFSLPRLEAAGPPDTEREISSESVQHAAGFLRQEARAIGRTLTSEEAERQARLMLSGQDV